MNDACEARLKACDRYDGEVIYAALLSPVSVTFIFRDTCGRSGCDKRHPWMRVNHSRRYWGKVKYINDFPISLLLTAMPDKKATGRAARPVRQVPLYALLGTKKRIGRRAQVDRYELTESFCKAAEQADGADFADARDDSPDARDVLFRCLLRHTTRGDIDITFATQDELNVLRNWLASSPKSIPQVSG